MASQPQMLKGLLELAVLSALDEGPLYGLSLLDRLREEAGLNVAEGSIYPLLHRLERSELIVAAWQLDEDGVRPRKYYQLTPTGRLGLKDSTEDWLRISGALTHFINRKLP